MTTTYKLDMRIYDKQLRKYGFVWTWVQQMETVLLLNRGILRFPSSSSPEEILRLFRQKLEENPLVFTKNQSIQKTVSHGPVQFYLPIKYIKNHRTNMESAKKNLALGIACQSLIKATSSKLAHVGTWHRCVSFVFPNPIIAPWVSRYLGLVSGGRWFEDLAAEVSHKSDRTIDGGIACWNDWISANMVISWWSKWSKQHLWSPEKRTGFFQPMDFLKGWIEKPPDFDRSSFSITGQKHQGTLSRSTSAVVDNPSASTLPILGTSMLVILNSS